MSGRKFTEVQLERERQERLDLKQAIETITAERAALRDRLDTALAGMTDGLRTSFPAETAACRAWLDTPVPANAHDESIAQLRQSSDAQTRHAESGRASLRELELALTDKADALARTLTAERIAAAETLLQHTGTLRLWYGAPAIADWQARLDQAARWIDEDRYPQAQDLLRTLQAELDTKAAEATDRETRHQRRLYLLKALRQVCADLYFTEVGEPAFEHSGERGSRLLLTVDTHDRGRIDFSLTLDGLGSFSEMGDRHCPVEFGTLSERLEEQFGIHTQFRPDGDQPTPELRRMGEKDLPGDGARQATAGGG